MFHEQFLNLLPGGKQILPLEGGPQILGYIEFGTLIEGFADLSAGILVARINHRKAVGLPQARPGIGRGDELRQLHDVGHRAAVRASREQNHVGPQPANALNFLVRQAAVVRGHDVHHDRPRAQRRALRAFRGHALDRARHEHLQAAPRARGGNINVHPGVALRGSDNLFAIEDFPAAEVFQLRQRVEHPASHVVVRRFHRGGRFAPEGLAIFIALLLDQNRLGGRTAAVGGDDDSQVLTHAYLRTPLARSTRSAVHSRPGAR